MPIKCVLMLVLSQLLSSVLSTALAEQVSPSVSQQSVFDHLSVRDQEGRVRELIEFKDKTVLVNFVFTRCSAVCPLQTQQIAAVQKQIPPAYRDAIRFLSVSVDPKHDSPKKLKAYAKARGVDFSNWAFVTVDQKAMTAFSHFIEVFDPRIKNPQPYDHTTQLYLFDRQGRLMQHYNGVPVDKTRIANEMQVLDDLERAGISAEQSARKS